MRNLLLHPANPKWSDTLLFSFIVGFIVSFLISLAFLNLAVGVISFFWLYDSFRRKEWRMDTYALLIGLFGLVRMGSIAFSRFPDVSIEAIQKEAPFYLSFFALLYFFKGMSLRSKRRIFLFLIGSGALVAVYGIVSFSLGMYERAQSVTSGYITFSIYLIPVILAAAIILPFASKKQKLLVSTIIALGLSGIFLSLTRSTIAVALVLLVVTLLMNRTPITVYLMIAGLTFVLVSGGLMMNSTGIDKRANNPMELSSRDVLIKGFLDIWDEHPLTGHGPRAFRETFTRQSELADKRTGSWHNDLIQIYIESGICALLLFLAVNVLLAYRAIRLLPGLRVQSEEQRIIAASVLGIGGILASSLLNMVIFSPDIALMYGAFIALFASMEAG